MGEDDMAPNSPEAEGVAAALVMVGAMMAPILETAVGYRTKCKDAGFSDSAADEMATAYHNGMLKLVLSKASG